MKRTTRYFSTIIAIAAGITAQAQQAKGPVQLGDQYFASGEYYTAAHLYGQYLHPSSKQKTASGFPLSSIGKRRGSTDNTQSRSVILYKQAESFRLANYFQEAADAYRECAEKNASDFPDALYWLGVCERSLGNYSSAEAAIQQYLKDAKEESPIRAAAAKEWETLLFIRKQIARADSILFKVSRIEAMNGHEQGLFAPVRMNNGQYLFSTTQKDTSVINGTNPYHSRLVYATLENDKLQEAGALAIVSTDGRSHQGAASLSPDGKHLYFSQWKKEKGQVLASIYVSRLETNKWSTPQLVTGINQDGFNSKQPFCTADGKFLFFSSDRPGGTGGFDVWYAPILEDGSLATPINAGAAINTTANEQAPYFHQGSETLVFSSNGYTGMGGYDLFTAKKNNDVWQGATNLGYPVNSSRDDIYFSAEGDKGLLSDALVGSDRGNGCCLETYRVVKAPKSKIFAGIIRDCENKEPVGGAEVILQDGTGKKWRTMTDADGRYTLDVLTPDVNVVAVTAEKDLYLQSNNPFVVDHIDETDLLTDKIYNADLCLKKKPIEKVEEPLVIKAEDVVSVYFDFDKSVLREDVVAKLDSIYTILSTNEVVTVQISGYTDGKGTAEYNKKLSDRRAKACADYLVQKGIDASRITFVSFGACCPVEMELINGRDNPDGRSRNRRALINIKKE